MSDYKSMYGALFNKVSEVISELQKIQRETEEMYIAKELPDIMFLNKNRDSED